ncbi:MAG TPA: tRNA (N(6)-L-threonylcarbamoyladenosine(37)-C(2))-methylthiotransferase MtaB [Anaerolineaceae bacterium]|nr:tRNA (N(6)-L-threonylcarbamoyladenosine(37)-C(2))-methylthiotransferase MtaB [Anaerolineaceae bacterium]
MKVFFDTVGCRLNQAEIEHMAAQFRAAGHQVIDTSDGADLVVVNTCAVTAAATSDSRQKARQAHQAGAHKIVLTGCWATLEPEKAGAIPGVNDVISNLEKMNLPLKVMESESLDFDMEPIARQPLPGAHSHTRAFIKAQDGCDNFCTFCVTRVARGKGQSVRKEEVLDDILQAERGGVREVVLSGVHLGSWGKDTGQKETIVDLLTYLLDHTHMERIRLSSIEPWDLDERFFKLWQNSRLCPHLHLPLQSGSAGVLKRMARHTTQVAFSDLVAMARAFIPGVSITTDVIVGFPGESEAEFEESLAFVKQMQFSGGHVFRYSLREGTAAAKLPDHVGGKTAIERAKKMHAVIKDSEAKFLSTFVGQEVKVLWEGSGKQDHNGWTLHGLSSYYMKWQARAETNRWNMIDTVLIDAVKVDGLSGNIIKPD